MQASEGQNKVKRTEDSANTAFEELMEEENRAAAKAAAKKAKKQKQKAKKQQAASAMSAEQAAPSDSEDEHDQFSLPPPVQSATYAPCDQSFQPSGKITESLSSGTITEGPSHPEPALDMPSDPCQMQANDLQADQLLHPGRTMPLPDGTAPSTSDLKCLSASQHRVQFQAAAVAQPEMMVQGDRSSQVAGQASCEGSEHMAVSDAQFLQALFCCPITKVSGAHLSAMCHCFMRSLSFPLCSLQHACG